jgi:signal transduction histidine kinase
VLTTLWSRLWLAVFLATVIPILAVLIAGIALTDRSSTQADLKSLERQARLLSAILAKQPTRDELTISKAVESVGRQLEILPLSQTRTLLPTEAVDQLRRQGLTSGHATIAGADSLFAAVRQGSDAVVLRRPYQPPFFDWRPWTGRFFLGAGLAALCSAVASLIVARAITRPVARVARASRRLAEGGPPAELETGGARELRDLTTAFNEMADQLTRAHEAERSFLLSVGHELKTPVAAIRGFAEGQREGVVAPDEASSFILDESDRLERLVQDLLDLARLNQHQFAIELEPVDLEALSGDAIQRCEPQARSLGVTLELRSRGPSTVIGDGQRVVQVLSNLLENGLRVTPAGAAVVVDVDDGRVSVADAGPGLSRPDLDHAFERFYLYRRYKNERQVGTGLGLALVAELAQAMGGEVTASSEQGAGSVFTLILRKQSDGSPERLRRSSEA